MTKYAKLNIQDPTSLQHLARVHPGQDICLSLDLERYEQLKVELASDHLSFEGACEKEGRKLYSFSLKEDVKDWDRYSSCMLGEIWVDAKDLISKVIVVLNATQEGKSDQITVINPDCYDVRVSPHQVIELVVFDLRFGMQDEWDCRWVPNSRIGIEEIGYDHLNLYSWYQFYDYMDDDPEYRYARCPRINCDSNPYCRQHHFWYRFDSNILEGEGSGVEHVGNLVVSGCADKFLKGRTQESSYVASVFVDWRKAKKGRILHTLGLDKKGDYSQYNYKHVQNFPRGNSIQPKKKQKQKHKTWLPETREVSVSCLATDSLENGCNVLSAIPWVEREENYGYDEHKGFDCCDYDYDYEDNFMISRCRSIIPYHKHRDRLD